MRNRYSTPFLQELLLALAGDGKRLRLGLQLPGGRIPFVSPLPLGYQRSPPFLHHVEFRHLFLTARTPLTSSTLQLLRFKHTKTLTSTPNAFNSSLAIADRGIYPVIRASLLWPFPRPGPGSPINCFFFFFIYFECCSAFVIRLCL